MYTYRATLDRIIDGDTIDVVLDLGFDVHLKSRVRMAGINTPESRTRDLEEKKRGLAAKDRLTELIEGKEFIIKTQISKERGKFGRVLGEVYVGDVNINQQLIQEGHAVAYFGGKR